MKAVTRTRLVSPCNREGFASPSPNGQGVEELLRWRCICRVNILVSRVNILVIGLASISSGQRRWFLRRDLVDVLAPDFIASVSCEAGEQRFVMNLDPDKRRSDENVDVGDLDISLVEKNDI